MHSRAGFLKILLIFVVVILVVGGVAALYGYTLTRVHATAPRFTNVERISSNEARVTGEITILNGGPMSITVGGIPYRLVSSDTNATVVNGTIPEFTVQSGENKTILFSTIVSRKDIAAVTGSTSFEATVQLRPLNLFTIPIPIESTFDVTGIANALLPNWAPKV